MPYQPSSVCMTATESVHRNALWSLLKHFWCAYEQRRQCTEGVTWMLSGMNPLYAQKQRKMVHRDAIGRVRAPVVCTKAKKIVHTGCHVGVMAWLMCTTAKKMVQRG